MLRGNSWLAARGIDGPALASPLLQVPNTERVLRLITTFVLQTSSVTAQSSAETL